MEHLSLQHTNVRKLTFSLQVKENINSLKCAMLQDCTIIIMQPGHSIYNKLSERAAKTQISLRIRAVRSDSAHGTILLSKDSKRPQADSEDGSACASAQAALFAGRIYNTLENAVPRLHCTCKRRFCCV